MPTSQNHCFFVENETIMPQKPHSHLAPNTIHCTISLLSMYLEDTVLTRKRKKVKYLARDDLHVKGEFILINDHDEFPPTKKQLKFLNKLLAPHHYKILHCIIMFKQQ